MIVIHNLICCFYAIAVTSSDYISLVNKNKLTKVVFIFTGINNYLFTFWTTIAFDMVRGQQWSFQMQSIFFLAVWKRAYFMFAFTPNGCAAVEITM